MALLSGGQARRRNFKCTDLRRRNNENLDKIRRTIEKINSISTRPMRKYNKFE